MPLPGDHLLHLGEIETITNALEARWIRWVVQAVPNQKGFVIRRNREAPLGPRAQARCEAVLFGHGSANELVTESRGAYQERSPLGVLI
jgi:hypothetical protein